MVHVPATYLSQLSENYWKKQPADYLQIIQCQESQVLTQDKNNFQDKSNQELSRWKITNIIQSQSSFFMKLFSLSKSDTILSVEDPPKCVIES